MSFLYVKDQGATIGVDGGYFVVKYKDSGDDMIRKIPSETLEYIAVFGGVHLTTVAIQKCLQNGIVISFFSKSGVYFGRISSTTKTNILRQRKQFTLSGNTSFSLNLSKKLIKAKIKNQLVVLKRYMNNSIFRYEEIVKQMKDAEIKMDNCNSIPLIMGYEGNASRYYFSGLSKIIRSDFHFNGRSRLPPKDPFNSMISLGYTLLMHEIYSAIESKGLSPYAGFLHQDRERHPTLASDLMEEWRAVLIDSLTLSLIQGNEVDIDMFQSNKETGGVTLKDNSFNIFISKYEKKLRSDTKYLLYIDEKISYRRAIWQQVDLLTKAIEENDFDIYKPIHIR
ncbi:MAG: CRISPR-associated endonuclease Cas1 [Fusobacteriaceae bacterium]|jgi:CRISPR-associated protein Cas1|nr:CRISPR-associated endonuclease Cas1 [Fusobacteriaceae bacterium]